MQDKTSYLAQKHLEDFGFKVHWNRRGGYAVAPETGNKMTLTRTAPDMHPTPGELHMLDRVKPHQARVLRAHGVNYVDSVGNAYINQPGVHIWVEGKRPQVPTRQTQSTQKQQGKGAGAFTKSGLKVIFILLANPHYVQESVRTIAHAAQVSVGTVSHTLQHLKDHGFMTEYHGQKILTRPKQLAEQWVYLYPLTLRPGLETYTARAQDPNFWADSTLNVDKYLSGEAALARNGYGIRPQIVDLYTQDEPHEAMRIYQLMPDETGTVVIRKKFWNAEDILGIPPLLIYADALAYGDSRVYEAAQKMWSDDENLRQLL